MTTEKTIEAIVIDPAAKTLTMEEFPADTMKGLWEAITKRVNYKEECSGFLDLGLDSRDCNMILVGGEVAYADRSAGDFTILGVPDIEGQWLSGRCVIFAIDAAKFARKHISEVPCLLDMPVNLLAKPEVNLSAMKRVFKWDDNGPASSNPKNPLHAAFVSLLINDPELIADITGCVLLYRDNGKVAGLSGDGAARDKLEALMKQFGMEPEDLKEAFITSA